MSYFELIAVGGPKGEILTIFDVPEFSVFARKLVTKAVDRLIEDREDKLREVKYDETKW